MLLSAPLLATLLVASSQDAPIIPPAKGFHFPVVTVSPRALTPEEDDLVREATNAGREIEIPKIGKFRPFLTEERRIAIWHGFLLTDRYTLAQRVLKRLGDEWKPGETTSLAGDEDLRVWLGQFARTDPNGKAPFVAEVCRISVQPVVVFQKGNMKRQCTSLIRDPLKPGSWPDVRDPKPDHPENGVYHRSFPLNMTIAPNTPSNLPETTKRIALVSQTLDVWMKEQDARLKKAAAKFFAKRDEGLAMRFGGNLPVGRSLEEIQPEMVRRLVFEFRSEYETNGFASKDAAEDWLVGAKIVSVTPILYAELPQYRPQQREDTMFPVSIP